MLRGMRGKEELQYSLMKGCKQGVNWSAQRQGETEQERVCGHVGVHHIYEVLQLPIVIGPPVSGATVSILLTIGSVPDTGDSSWREPGSYGCPRHRGKTRYNVYD